MKKLENLKKQSIPDQVFDLIKGYIDSGRFQAGDKIPSENELCRQLGVSRPSLKTALSRLQDMGLLEARVGDGTYVKECTAYDFLEHASKAMLHATDIREISELRRAIEMESVRLAADKADDNDLGRLEETARTLLKAIREKPGHTMEEDYQFHLQLCRCAHNRYLLMIYELIGGLVRNHIDLFVEQYVRSQNGCSPYPDAHWDLYEAVRQKDIDKACAILMDMLKV